MQLEIHGFETLLIVQRISPKQGARCKVGVREPPLGRFIRSWDTVVPVANACTILQYQLTSWGLVYCHPWPENLGWREQGLGLRSSLGQSQSQSQGQGQGQWLTSLSSREMANPRAGSEAKTRSMAMLVTTPEVRAQYSGPLYKKLKGVGQQSIVLAVLRFTTGDMIGPGVSPSSEANTTSG